MEIKIGDFYLNKTRRFLFPTLRYYGSDFTHRFNHIFKLAVGVYDYTLGDKMSGRNLFLMIDNKVREKMFEDFMVWITFQEYYVYSYNPEASLDSRRTMLILKVPETFKETYDYFLKSEYSLMYTEKYIDILFPLDISPNENKILKQHPEMYNKFNDDLLKEFGVKINAKYFRELELPLKCDEECFNYEGGNTFFNPKIDKIWQ